MNPSREELWVAQATGLWRSATRRAPDAERWVEHARTVFKKIVFSLSVRRVARSTHFLRQALRMNPDEQQFFRDRPG
jgi:hypothetical protein